MLSFVMTNEVNWNVWILEMLDFFATPTAGFRIELDWLKEKNHTSVIS